MRNVIFFICFMSLFFISCQNNSIKNPDNFIGKSITETNFDYFDYYFSIQNNKDGEKEYLLYALNERDRIFVFQVSPITNRIESYFYLSYIKLNDIKKYIGNDSAMILDNLGRPFIIQYDDNRKVIFYYYLQKERKAVVKSEISRSVICLKFDENEVVRNVENIQWARP